MNAAGEKTGWLETALAAIPRARVTVFGDFCLDAYWLIDPDESELSVETHLPVRRVRRQRYSLGGAGNIVANLAALGVGILRAVGPAGNDPFARRMLDLLGDLGADCRGLFLGQPDWQTPVYAKPCLGGAEQNRLDFGAFNVLADRTADALAERLDEAAGESDVVILNQQLPGGASPPAMIERLNAVAAARPDCLFIADSRHRPALYRNCLLKLNAHEAAGLLGEPHPLGKPIPAEDARNFARRLIDRSGRAVFITRGADGLVAGDAAGLHDIPGIPVPEPTDPVGAGDTVTAAVAAVLASGGDVLTAGRLANLAASVVVRKLQTTGTAGPEEIRRAAEPGR